jgi:hypothetical protein
MTIIKKLKKFIGSIFKKTNFERPIQKTILITYQTI